MAAPKGNDYGLKLKEPDIRQEAFRQYCAHIARGKTKENFFFEHPELTVTYKTLDKYIADYPEEFPSIHIEIAKMKGYQRWEQIVEDSAEGINEKANTASLQMLMRNKFKWDKDTQDKYYVEKEKTEYIKQFVIDQANALKALAEAKAQSKDRID